MLAREELVRLVRDAGFTPVQRDTLYREVTAVLRRRLHVPDTERSSHFCCIVPVVFTIAVWPRLRMRQGGIDSA